MFSALGTFGGVLVSIAVIYGPWSGKGASGSWQVVWTPDSGGNSFGDTCSWYAATFHPLWLTRIWHVTQIQILHKYIIIPRKMQCRVWHVTQNTRNQMKMVTHAKLVQLYKVVRDKFTSKGDRQICVFQSVQCREHNGWLLSVFWQWLVGVLGPDGW